MTNVWTGRVFAIGAVTVAAVALGWVSMSNLGENLVYYWSPTELQAKHTEAVGRTVRLGGLVVPGTFDLKACNPGCTFAITDGQTKVDIASSGLPPQMFREGQGVVVEGTLEGDGKFHTDRIMVKHSNEYKAPTSGENPAQGTLVTREDGT